MRDLGDRVEVQVGDATALTAAEGSYDAVFEYTCCTTPSPGRTSSHEAARVLRPGGRLFCCEMTARIVDSRPLRAVSRHPSDGDRPTPARLAAACSAAGLTVTGQDPVRRVLDRPGRDQAVSAAGRPGSGVLPAAAAAAQALAGGLPDLAGGHAGQHGARRAAPGAGVGQPTGGGRRRGRRGGLRNGAGRPAVGDRRPGRAPPAPGGVPAGALAAGDRPGLARGRAPPRGRCSPVWSAVGPSPRC